MDFDNLDRYNSLGRYEEYLRFMQLMDNMDMMEGICDTSMGEMNESLIRNYNPCKRINKRKIRLESNFSKVSEEEISEEYNSDDDSSSENDSMTFDSPKKKINLENPYRGLKDAGNPLETMEDLDFLNSYKFSKKTVYDVMELIKQGLITHTNRGTPIPPLIELLITLKYLTTGSIQKNAMDGVSQSTISRINSRVTKLIVNLQNRFIVFPSKSDQEVIKVKFYEKGKFPDVVGCIGSTHVGVRVKGIKDYNAGFVNEHGYHSVRVQVHQLMLQDEPRMMAYKTAIMDNKSYIEGKTVMDVGAGSGVLSLWCAMAGAKKVYAIEASDLAKLCSDLVKENKYENIIEVIHSKVEDVNLPNDEKVDIIISEWMGFYLLHEGMLDSVIYARETFLKQDGSIFPESATVYVAPCSVPSLYDFWENVHGIKMNCMASALRKTKSRKPEICKVEEHDLLTEKVAFCWIDLKEDSAFEIDCYSLKHVAGALKAAKLQGVAIWFECQFPAFNEEENPVILSTSPSQPLTHWKQTIIVLPEDKVLEEGEPIAWELSLKRSTKNNRRYDLHLSLNDPAEEIHPTPCSCYMTKCIIIKKFMEQHPDGKENFGDNLIDVDRD